MAAYTKQDLLNDIHDLVEKYIIQELEARLPVELVDEELQIVVESDSEGDDIDKTTGDIWDIENQKVIGKKDLQTNKKFWFESETDSANEKKEKEPSAVVVDEPKELKEPSVAVAVVVDEPKELKEPKEPKEPSVALVVDEPKELNEPSVAVVVDAPKQPNVAAEKSAVVPQKNKSPPKKTTSAKPKPKPAPKKK